jgi:AraC-like DNA-binding protein
MQLDPGDLVVLPVGPRHWLRDDPQSPTTELEDILTSTSLDAHHRLHHGGGGAPTSLLCGGFALDGAGSHPILDALPPLLIVRGSDGRPVPWLAATISLLSAETNSNAPGAEEVAARLADSLLTQALRVGLLELHAQDATQLRALRDPQIATAIALIHSRPGRAWAVGELASEVALSRSEFAARFRSLVGESPIRYITRTRLAHAAELLRTSNASLADIAARSGYGTPFSFSKAFKRTFGIAPGAYRGQASGQPKLRVAATRRGEA